MTVYVEQSGCIYKNSGCADMKACNYNERAIYDDGSVHIPNEIETVLGTALMRTKTVCG